MANPPQPARARVVIEPYDPARETFARDVYRQLQSVLRDGRIFSVEHVGATSVAGLAGQAIVDFAVRVPTLADVDGGLSPALEGIGWMRVPRAEVDRRRFVRIDGGREVTRLDVFDDRTLHWIRRKRFRDALRSDAVLRREYTTLRLALADQFARDPEAYARGKSDFIERALVAPGPVKPHRCPVCRLPTLDGRGDYEICGECGWEDDGQDDADADEVRGGPNGPLSLAAAHLNYARAGAYDDTFVPNGQYPDVPAVITPAPRQRPK